MKKIFAALLITSLAPFAMAEGQPTDQPLDKPKFEHRKEMKDKFEKELGLTEEQKAQIKAIKEKYKGSKKDERAEIEAVFTPEQKAKIEQMKSERPHFKGKKERPEHPASE